MEAYLNTGLIKIRMHKSKERNIRTPATRSVQYIKFILIFDYVYILKLIQTEDTIYNW
ncbi:hypothetical protein BCR33DRAFT_713980 [Rhizoclosmatium globosum]|uniref:Uncharacterized protein n=1 Tax=Rhizoclosmatium globosum TaxID=329046 RepID=A0A1Y2BCC2_9FUNG|nr:hypothetical protein BCR33DRAFT_727694 [Rhizoclosmatium globosum]ORY32482.1 hypothetical protein BCR33DRAFT_723496 [Rhizoclosmatium globosum]ORY43277.1 hypothetical protein BCR33DRAFT_717524 [Rhizoclosmatium globosum]ORY48865.1 hypothetical protein BCR33DRAFT_713980 [Rhizoclosmatium globosum]|eukprot:ORY24142.1 hypothetical protein BCR33DRAFT_727694 [Rhizoclosmatium globosum]